jgi:hypothetical protein
MFVPRGNYVHVARMASSSQKFMATEQEKPTYAVSYDRSFTTLAVYDVRRTVLAKTRRTSTVA